MKGDGDSADSDADDDVIDAYWTAMDADGRPELEQDHFGTVAEMLLDLLGDNSIALSDLDERLLANFLLVYYPSTYALPEDPEYGPNDPICPAVARFVEFVGATGRIEGGAARAEELRRLVDRLDSAVVEACADPRQGRELFARLTYPALNPTDQPSYFELVSAGQLTDDEIENELNRRLEAFGALPPDEQQAALDAVEAAAIDGPPRELNELPFLYVEPPPDEVQRAAAGAPILAKIRTLQARIDESGRPDPDTDELVFEIAKDVQAVLADPDDSREQPWNTLAPVDQASEIYGLLAQFGVLSYHTGETEPLAELNDILDAGAVHWQAMLLAPDYSMSIDDLVFSNIAVASQDLPWHSGMDEAVERGIARIIEIFCDAGVLALDEATSSVSLTPFGSHVVARDVAGVGYLLHRADELADAAAEKFVDALAVADDAHRENVAAAWQPTRTDDERVSALTELLSTADDPELRMRTLSALDLFDGDVVAPALRTLLSGDAAGYAALYLMSRDLAGDDDLSEYVDVGLFVDILAGSLDDPELLCGMFTHAPGADDPFAALEQMWRHPSPDTQLVLDALGRHLPDKSLAKAARKALQKHRSWIANQN